jgi:alkanesulfonate monooxygenase SsuD/methylene tetrahydromethanopterin reductase-like flavin-dependent oxidoreductase (luciferase family)
MGSTLATDAEVRSQVGWYTDALASAGRDLSEVDVVVAREVFLAETGERARERALSSLRTHLDAVRSEGSDDATGLGALRASESELLDSCFLVGSPAEVLDRLKSMQADLGMTHLVARVFLPGRAHVDVLDSIRLLASEIATRLLA